PAMRAYIGNYMMGAPGDGVVRQLRRAVESVEKNPPGSEGFLRLAEGYFASVRQTRDTSAVAGKLNGFYKAWDDGGRLGQEIGCIVRSASNMEKIGLADV